MKWYGYRLSRIKKRDEDLVLLDRSFWDDFFRNFPEKFIKIYINNRNNLREVTEWMPGTVHQNSLFRYGISESRLGANHRNQSIICRQNLRIQI